MSDSIRHDLCCRNANLNPFWEASFTVDVWPDIPSRKRFIENCTVRYQRCIASRKKELQKRQKRYYDQGAKSLPVLKSGERVYYQVGKEWKPGVVTTQDSTPRSYHIQSEKGGRYRRNRHHLKKRRAPEGNIHVPVNEETEVPEACWSEVKPPSQERDRRYPLRRLLSDHRID